MTKHLQKIILLMMLCVVGTARTFADGQEYISDVKVFYAKYVTSQTSDSLLAVIASEGYSCNGMNYYENKKNSTYISYIGYKTSKDAKEAITGLLTATMTNDATFYDEQNSCTYHQAKHNDEEKGENNNVFSYYALGVGGVSRLYYTKDKTETTQLLTTIDYESLSSKQNAPDSTVTTVTTSSGKVSGGYNYPVCRTIVKVIPSEYKYIYLKAGYESHTHSYSYKDQGDGTHKYWCETCGYVKSSEDHTMTYKDNNDGTHSYLCADCDYVESTTAHTYANIKDNGNGTCSGTCSYCNHKGNGVTYSYPIYNTDGDATSGIKSWTTGYCFDYREVTSSTSTLGASGTESWYVASGTVALSSQLVCQGNVNLILKDGASLSVNSNAKNKAGISVSTTGSFSVYGQDKGTGSLTATGGLNAAGIGGGYYKAAHDIFINGGVITATAGDYGAGIGGGREGEGYNIYINGGVVTATAGLYAAGIGGGDDKRGYNIFVNGGFVKANAGIDAACIGAGQGWGGYNIHVNANYAVKADDVNPPVNLIDNNGGDIASKISRERYVEITPYLEYEQFKAEKAAYIRALGLSDDTDADKAIISNAAAAVEALTYDTSKTQAANKAAVDAIVSKCIEDLASMRLKETRAIVDANNYKVTFKGEWTYQALNTKLASGTFDNGSLAASKVGLVDVTATLFTDATASSITIVNPNTLIQAKTTSQVTNEYNVLVDGVCNKFLMTDGNEFTCPVGFTATNVSYSRSFTGQWQPLYLPFSIAVDNLKADYDIAYIIGVRQEDTDNDGAIDYQCIDVAYVPEGTKTNANYPYIIRRKTAADDVTTDLGSTAVLAAADNTVDCSTFLNTYYIYCTYFQTSAETLSGKYSFSDDALMLNDGTTALAPQNWYLSIESSADAPYDMKSQNSGAKFFIHIIGEEDPDVTTGIHSVDNGRQAVDNCYNAAGQRVKSSAKGLIIKNGRKYFNK